MKFIQQMNSEKEKWEIFIFAVNFINHYYLTVSDLICTRYLCTRLYQLKWINCMLWLTVILLLPLIHAWFLIYLFLMVFLLIFQVKSAVRESYWKKMKCQKNCEINEITKKNRKNTHWHSYWKVSMYLFLTLSCNGTYWQCDEPLLQCPHFKKRWFWNLFA